jgi:hypothetical protein
VADNEKKEARTKEELEAHLRRLHVRFDEVRGDEPYVMAHAREHAGPNRGPSHRLPCPCGAGAVSS